MLLAEKIGLNLRVVGISAGLAVLVVLSLARFYESRERGPGEGKRAKVENT
jgi:hypothetical protein